MNSKIINGVWKTGMISLMPNKAKRCIVNVKVGLEKSIVSVSLELVEQITAKYHKNLSFLETSTKIGTHTP